jgi:hypothetical protein
LTAAGRRSITGALRWRASTEIDKYKEFLVMKVSIRFGDKNYQVTIPRELLPGEVVRIEEPHRQTIFMVIQRVKDARALVAQAWAFTFTPLFSVPAKPCM